MKYENFDQVKSIVEQIQAYEEKLAELDTPPLNIVVKQRYTQRVIYTIGAESDSQDEYANIGRYVVAAISVDLKERIDNLKSILEKL